MECPICYEIITSEQYQHLDCSHIICKTCTRKLQQCLCPLCRAPIDPLLCGQNQSSTINQLQLQQYLFSIGNIGPNTRILSRRRRNNRIPNLSSLILREIIEMVIDNTDSDNENNNNEIENEENDNENEEIITHRHSRRNRNQ